MIIFSFASIVLSIHIFFALLWFIWHQNVFVALKDVNTSSKGSYKFTIIKTIITFSWEMWEKRKKNFWLQATNIFYISGYCSCSHHVWYQFYYFFVFGSSAPPPHSDSNYFILFAMYFICRQMSLWGLRRIAYVTNIRYILWIHNFLAISDLDGWITIQIEILPPKILKLIVREFFSIFF